MILLADNDIVLKLAQCDLIDSLDEILQVAADQILIPSTARFQLMPRSEQKALAKCGNAETITRLQRFLALASDVPVVQDLELLLTMSQIPDIDAGEQQLFATLASAADSTLLTGDKRALRAVLANRGQIAQVHAGLVDSVITFESALLLSLDVFGFPVLKQKLLACPKPDKMLQLVLRPDMSEAVLAECLVSYTREFYPLLANKERLPEALRNNPLA